MARKPPKRTKLPPIAPPGNDADTTADASAKRAPGRPFAKGQSGNPAGRPKGSRNKISTDFLNAITEDFELYGTEAIKSVRENKPEAYLKIVADLVPKDINLKHDASEAFANIWQMIGGGTHTEPSQ